MIESEGVLCMQYSLEGQSRSHPLDLERPFARHGGLHINRCHAMNMADCFLVNRRTNDMVCSSCSSVARWHERMHTRVCWEPTRRHYEWTPLSQTVSPSKTWMERFLLVATSEAVIYVVCFISFLSIEPFVPAPISTSETCWGAGASPEAYLRE